jgi:ABC-type taurine transport system ATPase subunit
MRMSGVLVSTEGRSAPDVAEAVADGILDFQRGEFQATQRRLDRGDVDAYRVMHAEPVFPWLRQCQIVDVVFIGVAGMRHAHQHARGDARMQIEQVRIAQGAGTMYAARNLL